MHSLIMPLMYVALAAINIFVSVMARRKGANKYVQLGALVVELVTLIAIIAIPIPSLHWFLSGGK